MATELEIWQSAWRTVGVGDADRNLLDELMRRYAEPHRKYHTMQHLSECFANLELLRDSVVHPGEVELALWFHDAIYDIRRQDNELRSADWVRSAVLGAGVFADIADRIHALVMVTRHDALPETPDEKILVDVDLSILGAAPERFEEYEQQVRAEYAWVPGILFRRKRRSILGEFLERASIYNTDRFVALFEEQARTNLRRSIARLGGRASSTARIDRHR